MILTLYRVLYIMWQFRNATFELLLRSKRLTWTLKWKVRFFKCTFLLEWWLQSRLFLWFQMVAQVTDFNHLSGSWIHASVTSRKHYHYFLLLKIWHQNFLRTTNSGANISVFANSVIFKCLVCPPPPLSVKQISDILLDMLENPSKHYKKGQIFSRVYWDSICYDPSS